MQRDLLIEPDRLLTVAFGIALVFAGFTHHGRRLLAPRLIRFVARGVAGTLKPHDLRVVCPDCASQGRSLGGRTGLEAGDLPRHALVQRSNIKPPDRWLRRRRATKGDANGCL
jgi:hypothetical protein